MTPSSPFPALEALAAAWDRLRYPIWVFDPHRLQGVYANTAALALWDAVSLDELLSRDFSQLSATVLTRTRRLAEATADGSHVNERWTFYPKGNPATVQAVISTLALQGRGPVLLFEASPEEVGSGERRAVEALRHTTSLISLFDEAGELIFANPSAFAAYGADSAFEARFAASAAGREMLARALAGESPSQVCEVATTQGARWHHLDARRVLDPVTGAPGVLLNELDVTARVEAERARAAAEQKAAMAEARQKFLAEMSHELKTPLNAVIGFSELLARSLSADQADQARRIHQSGERLLVVVNDMIRLSQSVDEVPPPAAASTPDEPGQVLAPDAALRVLYVDDNESNRVLVKAILESQGIACATADDGAQGVAAARAEPWDMILMDIQMPVMDGVEATLAIRASPGDVAAIPIVALTANTLEDDIERYAQAGIDDCIGKPVDARELLLKVLTWSQAAPLRRGPAAASETGRDAAGTGL